MCSGRVITASKRNFLCVSGQMRNLDKQKTTPACRSSCSTRPADELTFRFDKNRSISVDNFSFISARQKTVAFRLTIDHGLTFLNNFRFDKQGQVLELLFLLCKISVCLFFCLLPANSLKCPPDICWAFFGSFGSR